MAGSFGPNRTDSDALVADVGQEKSENDVTCKVYKQLGPYTSVARDLDYASGDTTTKRDTPFSVKKA